MINTLSNEIKNEKATCEAKQKASLEKKAAFLAIGIFKVVEEKQSIIFSSDGNSFTIKVDDVPEDYIMKNKSVMECFIDNEPSADDIWKQIIDETLGTSHKFTKGFIALNTQLEKLDEDFKDWCAEIGRDYSVTFYKA